MISVKLNIAAKHYQDGVSVIREFHGKINAGKITAIVGPSGCGKTTLLNMIAGLESSNANEIRFSSDDSDNTPRIGYIFQTPRLMPWLTTRENLELVSGKGDPAITSMLKEMGILDKQHAYPSALSGGMQRRVSIARAFVYHPQVLLLDEPFTSLDAPTADQLRQLLIAQWRLHESTMIFVTHDLREAIALADEIWFLSPSPTSIIHTLAIEQPPERLLCSEVGRQRIDDIASTLLSTHPNLLSGSLSVIA